MGKGGGRPARREVKREGQKGSGKRGYERGSGGGGVGGLRRHRVKEEGETGQKLLEKEAGVEWKEFSDSERDKVVD